MSQHPFALELGELEEVLKSSSETNRQQAQAAEEPEGCDCDSPTEEDATTERMGEEGGSEPDELPDATTLALGEEGGDLPPDFPDATGILAEQGGFISEALPVATTTAVREEEGELPSPILESEEDATTERLAEEGGMEPQELPPPPLSPGDIIFDPLLPPPPDFPDPTGIVAEQGGFFSEIPPGPPDIFLEPPAQPTTLAVGEEGGDGDVEIAEVETLAGTPDEGNLEFITDAFGEPGGFEADAYGELYPELVDAVNSGIVPSLLDHYEAFGQFEPERIGIFGGNFERPDIVTSFGNNTIISGIPIIGYDPLVGDFIFNGNGSGEFGFDILIGESSLTSTETFVLGNSQSQSFYVGSGDVDYALIQNFDVGSDKIQLSGVLTDYNFTFFDNSTRISTAADDLVAVVENVPNIQDATLIFEG
jgi:hypothetical protein